MDAEIWSQADIRNGGRLLVAMLAFMLLKDLGGLVLPLFGLPIVDPLLRPTHGPGAILLWKAPAVLLVKLLLAILVFQGFQLARVGLGAIFLVGAAFGLGHILAGGHPSADPATLLAVADVGLGLLIGGLFLASPQLRAYCWHRGPSHMTIPIPLEDDIPARPARRSQNLGELIGAALRRLLGLLLVGALIGAAAYIYGLPDLLHRHFESPARAWPA